MISDEQAKQVKEQLLKQLTNFPEDKREFIGNKIVEMSNEELEEFIKQNQLTQSNGGESGGQGQCIFCAIAGGDVPSFKIGENEESIAVLELNPLSKGHSLIIPKIHVDPESIPSLAFDLAKELGEKLKAKFNPSEIKISSISIMGHGIVEVLPLYGDEKERRKASEEELKSLQEEILKEDKKEEQVEVVEEEEKEIPVEELPVFKSRIP